MSVLMKDEEMIAGVVPKEVNEVGTTISLSENALSNGDTFTVSDEVNKILQSDKFLLQIFVNDRSENPSARRFSLYGKVGHQLITGYGDRTNPSIGVIRFQYSNKTFTVETYQQIYVVGVRLIVL